MKNNEMVSSGMFSLKLPDKFVEDHPVATTVIYVAPVILPVIVKGTKYIIDKISYTTIECCRIKAMAENSVADSADNDDLETISIDDSITT